MNTIYQRIIRANSLYQADSKRGGSIAGETMERVKRLCAEIATEQDKVRFGQLVSDLYKELQNGKGQPNSKPRVSLKIRSRTTEKLQRQKWIC